MANNRVDPEDIPEDYVNSEGPVGMKNSRSKA